jgi:hypothetical protein
MTSWLLIVALTAFLIAWASVVHAIMRESPDNDSVNP